MYSFKPLDNFVKETDFFSGTGNDLVGISVLSLVRVAAQFKYSRGPNAVKGAW